ncbi:DNA-directed DNA polymerase [Tanacetum coccineum]|uniref:DNA-directed DNA polymerase n=1 Tax=Tanacetum coccineum TaxID=301880 RepID=A0ABQ5HZW8_9ASTR
MVKKLEEPFEELEREMHKCRKAARRQQRNESLSIARQNLFNDEASSSVNSKRKITPPIKSLQEHSSLNASSFLNLIILLEEPTNKVLDAQDILLVQDTCSFQGLCTENTIHYIKYLFSIVDHLQADEATKDASRLCLFHFSLKGKAKEWLDKISPETITSWEQLVSKFLDKFF